MNSVGAFHRNPSAADRPPTKNKAGVTMLGAVAFIGMLLCCCTSSSSGSGGSGSTQNNGPITIATAPAQNGAQIVTLTSNPAGATLYYTLDGTTPTTSSQTYEAPFLVASNLTLNVIAVAGNGPASSVVSKTFTPSIPSGTLVWSDEFSNSTSANAPPNPHLWNYDSGPGMNFGPDEQENYCAWNSDVAPCSASSPNAYVGTDGYLHIVAQQPSPGVYTSGRINTTGLFSFEYGRFEVRAMVPEAQGYWPAVWLMGNNNATIHWPACGEMDVLERVDAPQSPDWNAGSIHGTGFIVGNLSTYYDFPGGQTASQWHTYGMIWTKGSVAYYVDNPSKPYVTYTPASLNNISGAAWPFDAGQSNYIIINLAVGGSWPGSPNSSTPFPSQMLVDYVRVYTN